MQFTPPLLSFARAVGRGRLLSSVRFNSCETIQDLNLDEQNQEVKRHNGTPAPPVKDRPRRGQIGFQELSRGGDHVQIRNARIRVLD